MINAAARSWCYSFQDHYDHFFLNTTQLAQYPYVEAIQFSNFLLLRHKMHS